MLLIGFPGLLLGAAPLLVSIWIASILSKAAIVYTDVWPVLLLALLIAFGWLVGRPLLRLAESSFWSLNALAVQPVYMMFREGCRHLVEGLLPRQTGQARRSLVRACTAAVSGLLIGGLGLGLVVLAWPTSRWIGTVADLAAPYLLVPIALTNSIIIFSGYLALAAMIWGTADATMPQPRDIRAFHARATGYRTWRVAHLSDIHTVGERYGFRVESGRSGPRGNERLRRALAILDKIHAAHPLDVILITGDVTDAGRSAEWAEFFTILAAHPRLAELVVALPGNHDVNVLDRANPARMVFPTSPIKRLRQVRTMCALGMLQGGRFRVVESKTGRLGGTLTDALRPHAIDMAAFADNGSARLSRRLAGLWMTIFPMVLPPDMNNGLGIVVLNSNAETHFSFTNALGLVSAEQVRAFRIATEQYTRACWIVALHHHVVEYPRAAKALSERIGTALINGSWFARRMQPLANRAVIMHGHRHVDWIGESGGVLIVSAPSPVMEATDRMDTFFYIHTLGVGGDGRLKLLEPERISVRGEQAGDGAWTC
jgi:hypothetical protein